MNYFEAISFECEKLNILGQEYLNQFSFLPNDEILNRIYSAANKIFIKSKENWNAVPEWVALTMDYSIPYSKIPHNGSIFFALGFSSVSQDAHLRNLLEIAEGRTEKWLDFPVLVDKDDFDLNFDMGKYK